MFRKFLKAVLAVLFAVLVFGVGSAQKPVGGGGSRDIPMKAVFSYGFKIFGDSAQPYVHQGTKIGVDNVSISSPNMSGNFVMAIYANGGRYVNLFFDTRFSSPEDPNPAECAESNFLSFPDVPVQTTYYFLRTYWKCQYIPHQDPDGTLWTELVRSTTSKDATILNLTTMRPGETVGVSVEMMNFRPMDDLLTPGYNESQDLYGLSGYPIGAGYLLVTATDWNGDGVMDWILRTIPGRLVVMEHDRVTDLPDGDVFKLTCGWPCAYGSFQLPFELKIARK